MKNIKNLIVAIIVFGAVVFLSMFVGARIAHAGITGGPVTVQQLGGGVGASSTTFWRGDGTWAAVTGGLTGLTQGTPNYNTALGSGFVTPSGQFNTSIGAFAGSALTTGASNAFLGHFAGANVTTQNNNTYVGYEAGRSWVGHDNINIGGKGNAGYPTGNYNVFLGAINNGYLTQSNQVLISDGASNIVFLANGLAATASIPAFLTVTQGFASSVSPEITATTYTQLVADADLLVNLVGNCTITLLNPVTYPGRYLNIRSYQASTVTSASANVSINGTVGTSILTGIGKWVTMKSDGTNWEVILNN